MSYTKKSFSIPEITGLSKEQIDAHLKLYEGYVKHSNLIIEKIDELSKNKEENAYMIAELRRRFGFEFNGMRNHEYYFGHLEGGAQPMPTSQLKEEIDKTFGSFDNFKSVFKNIALSTRGNGWLILAKDRIKKNLVLLWVSDHEIGQCTDMLPVFVFDVWEHAYMVDYVPAQKGEYVEAYLNAVNWEKLSEEFANTL
ncbi:MAG: superoxide dismutase [Candidatus Campbellbacteria bacterium]|nr:superoxide dismutase [Candidatus Campbellbacteria bacterium]